MAKKLKSLYEHNSITSTFHWGMMRQSPVPNGIACPKCREELLINYVSLGIFIKL